VNICTRGWFLAEMGAGQDPQVLKIAEKTETWTLSLSPKT
jgi:hypothetical protein